MLHEGEFPIDDALVAGLIADQFPQWADLPLSRVQSSGTVNAIYRLGNHMAVRMPRLGEFSAGIERELRWLPVLAPFLPVPIPETVAEGAATDRYPSPWSVLRWIDGENATLANLADPIRAATRLGEFVRAFRGVDIAGAPIANDRGLPLVRRDSPTRAAIEMVADEFAADELNAAWDRALGASPWIGEPVWFHGDLHTGNLLATSGELSAVIDFGGCSVGDPTCDLIAGWWVFAGDSRRAFREAVQADDDSWRRGRGWALSVALIALPYYVDSNPVFAEMARSAIRSVLADR